MYILEIIRIFVILMAVIFVQGCSVIDTNFTKFQPFNSTKEVVAILQVKDADKEVVVLNLKLRKKNVHGILYGEPDMAWTYVKGNDGFFVIRLDRPLDKNEYITIQRFSYTNTGWSGSFVKGYSECRSEIFNFQLTTPGVHNIGLLSLKYDKKVLRYAIESNNTKEALTFIEDNFPNVPTGDIQIGKMEINHLYGCRIMVYI